MKKRILAGLISIAMAAAFIPAAFAQTTEFEYSWDFNDRAAPGGSNENGDFTWVNGNAPAEAIAGPSAEADDYAFGYLPAMYGNATAGEKDLHRYSIGPCFLKSTLGANPIEEAEFVASVDFMYYNEDMYAYILSPRLKDVLNIFPLSIKLVNGMLSCNTEEKPYNVGVPTTTRVLSSAELGKVAAYVWHNVAVKYTISPEGLTADVYLDGELKAQGLTYDKDNSGICGFISVSSAKADPALCGNGVRTANRNEQIYLDNLYIGTDLTKVDYDFAISKVENASMDELTVHFNRDIDAPITEDDIWVSTESGDNAASVQSVTVIDSRTVKLNLDTALNAYTKYAITYLYGDGIITYDFTPDIALFYDFNTDNNTYCPFAPNTNNSASIIKAHEQGRYGIGSNDYDMSFVTHVSTQYDSAGVLNQYSNGYNIYGTPGGIAVKNGTLNVSFDFKYDSENMVGWLIAPRLRGSVPNPVRFEGNKLYCGNNDMGVDLQKNTWYNITATYRFYAGGVTVDVYLDGEKVGVTCFNGYAGGFNTVSTLINAKTPDELIGARADNKDTRNEYFHMDNCYISINRDYHTSSFQTRFADNRAVISSGAFDKSGTAFVALYDGDMLKCVKVADFALDKLNTMALSAEFDEYEEGNTIKLISVENVNNLTPLNTAAVK